MTNIQIFIFETTPESIETNFFTQSFVEFTTEFRSLFY